MTYDSAWLLGLLWRTGGYIGREISHLFYRDSPSKRVLAQVLAENDKSGRARPPAPQSLQGEQADYCGALASARPPGA